MELIKQLFDKLYNAYYMSSDPRYYGENPICDTYEDELIRLLKPLDDKKIEAFIEKMDVQHLDSIHFVLEEIMDDHPFVRMYLNKTGW